MAVHRLLLCAVTIATIAPAAAQEPDERPALKKYEYELTVSGCVKGKRLEDPVVRSAPEHLRVDALNLAVFILDGPKELLKQIEKEHKNHNDQLIGIATIPPTWFQQQGGITSRKVGPISIGIGRQEISPMQQSTPHIRLKVSSIVHVLDTCRGGGR
jgi:hypothetical protein